MQLDAIIPPQAGGMRPEQALASILQFDQVELVRRLSGLGFNPVELGGDLGALLPHTFSPPVIAGLQGLKDEIGLNYTCHLPLWSIEPSTPQAQVRQGSVQALVQAVQAVEPLDPEVYVLHATGALAAEFYRMRLPEVARAVLMRQMQANAMTSIRELLSQTGLPSYRLAIETVEFPFDLTVEIAEQLNCSLCLDTGHVLAGFAGAVDLFDALERCLPRLAEIHLHDCPRWDGISAPLYGADHRPLGQGALDLSRLLHRLVEAGFTGPLIFELFQDQALASLPLVHAVLGDQA